MPTTLRNTDILFNDGTTQSTAATSGALVTTANVLAATAGASLGAVGTYAFMGDIFGTTVNPGNTKAGSQLRYAGIITYVNWNSNYTGDAFGSGYSSTTPAGTWRCMGYTTTAFINCITSMSASVWLRIS